MAPQEIAEVWPQLLDFAAEMLGGLARKDQRAMGELYVGGRLTGGQRKLMVPMAVRLGADHQRLGSSSRLDVGLRGGAAECGVVVCSWPAGGGAGDR